jgi:lysophospholipase L1-like esterase
VLDEGQKRNDLCARRSANAMSSKRRASPVRRGATVVVLVALVSFLGLSAASAVNGATGRSRAQVRTSARPHSSSGFLLALGDSLAAGYQPSYGSSSPPVDPVTGYPDQGYPGGYASDLAAARHLDLVDLACPGETTLSMIGQPARAQCAEVYREEFADSSQLAAALTFLSRHKGDVDLVTIDLGANDIESCTDHGEPEPSCLRSGAVSAAHRLPLILSRLKAALGRYDPGTRLVGMNYYDPFLGLDFRPGGAKASAAAFLSLVLLETYDGELDSIYALAKVPVANVAAAFASGTTTPLTPYGGKRLPRNVALVCTWTWMCPLSSAKSPDIHANTAGYGVISAAFEKVIAGS